MTLEEREQKFKEELLILMDKYSIGLTVATVDAKPLPTIEA